MRHLIKLVEQANPKNYFFVTFSNHVPNRLAKGIQYGTLGGNVELFSDNVAAVQYAVEVEKNYGKPVDILVISNPPGLQLRKNADGFERFITDEPIPAEHIRSAITLSSAMKRRLENGEDLMVEDVEEIDEDVLQEKLFFNADVRGTEVPILQNPTRQEMIGRLTNEKHGGWIRGFLTDDGNVYVWSAYLADHMGVGSCGLGIAGKKFEIRGKENDPQQGICSILYLNRSDYMSPERCAAWRAERRMARLFGKSDFKIGALRW